MFFKARVIAVNPQSHSCDIVSMDDGRRFSGVQVLAQMAGGNVGHVDLPSPTVTDANNPFESANTGVRDIYALVAFVSRDIPVILGFIYPQVAQCLFSAQNFRVDRHASDVYTTLDGSGNYEFAHPSGTYIRIGETTPHADLTGLDYDQRWKIANNTASTPSIHISVANGGAVKSTIDIDKNGNVSITNIGATTVTTTGEITLNSSNLKVNSTLHVTGNVTADADVTASGKSLVHHVHSGVQSGGSNTGQPV